MIGYQKNNTLKKTTKTDDEKVAGFARGSQSQKTTVISNFQRAPGLLAPLQGGKIVEGNWESPSTGQGDLEASYAWRKRRGFVWPRLMLPADWPSF